LKECHEEVLKQIKEWSQPDYFTDEQLQTAKEIIRRNYIRSSEKPSTLSMQVTYQWCSTSLDYFTDYQANLEKVKKEDIRQYINKYISNSPFVAGMIINEEMNKQLKPEEFFQSKSF
jgi:zinc protease